MTSENNLLGIGLYTVGEASRLTGISPARIRRWLQGYRYRRDGETVWADPLWHSQVEDLDDGLTLGFRDLAELRVVKALLNAGLSLQSIRRAIEAARMLVEDERPFSTTRFKTDGRSVFLEVAGEEDDRQVIDLLTRQYGFREIILPSLQDLEFDAEAAVRWWPLSRRRQVVLDPMRRFGQPIVADAGIATDVLADAVAAEGSIAAVVRLYNVRPAAVADAVAFQQRMAA